MWNNLYNCSWEVYIFCVFSRNTSFLWNCLLSNNCLLYKIMMFYATDTILVKFFHVIFISLKLSLLSAPPEKKYKDKLQMIIFLGVFHFGVYCTMMSITIDDQNTWGNTFWNYLKTFSSYSLASLHYESCFASSK